MNLSEKNTIVGNLISAAELEEIIRRVQSGETTLESEAAANIDAATA